MRKFLMILTIAMLMCTAACAEDLIGTWSGGMEDQGVRILTVLEDGTGVLTENGTERKITWDDARQVYADGGKKVSEILTP